MKKFSVVFALFAAMIFVVSCGGGSKTSDNADTGEKGCSTQKLCFGNICTGQDKCYDYENSEITCPAEGEDFFGQDVQYQGVCIPQDFTVQTISSQTVVLDNNTGLMWQQTIPTDIYKWDGAVSYCDSLKYAGYSDWRLPTPQELLTIVDNSKDYPAIDTSYFPDTPDYHFWSSSTNVDVDYTDYAWCVDFGDGRMDYHDKTIQYWVYVRCVRGATLPTGSFKSSTVHGDVIVTDRETGLIWQKTYVTDKIWQEALSYCETLTYAGYSDWRLPNKNELASLVNYKKYNPASDFPDMPSIDSYFWSSSTFVCKTRKAWGVHFYSGRVYDQYRENINRHSVRCVR